jgi:UDP-hydrolysing UDP-N-acetyl-D-glucosamine 2-epimerase
MSNTRKVCILVNSRANYGRIKSVIAAVAAHPALELQLVAGASALLYRFGNVREIIEADGFAVDATVYSIVEGENPTTMAKSTGMAILELATLFENLKPDIVLTVADRFETMATAVAASYMNIPLAHTQGGEVTGSIDESVRHAITKLAHIHFPATERAARNILQMGEDADRIFMTGCPSIDLIAGLDLALPADIFNEKGSGPDLDPNAPYLVVLQHPVTTEFGAGIQQIEQTLRAVHSCGIPAVWLWPNVDAGSDDISKGLRVFRDNNPDAPIRFFRNFPAELYAKVIAGAACLIGNSSSALREGAYLGVPAVNIGTRQQGRERGHNVVDAPYESAAIACAVEAQVAHGKYEPLALFGDGRAGARIADILAKINVRIQKQLAYPDAGDAIVSPDTGTIKSSTPPIKEKQ